MEEDRNELVDEQQENSEEVAVPTTEPKDLSDEEPKDLANEGEYEVKEEDTVETAVAEGSEEEPLENEQASQQEDKLQVEEEEEVVDKEIEDLITEIEDLLSSSSAENKVSSACSADQSSLATEFGEQDAKQKRLSQHKKDTAADSDDSACSLTAEEATLHIHESKTPPPMSPKETQTDWQASGVEIINLPLLKEMRQIGPFEENKKFEERVLGTGVAAHFKGPMPTVFLPLDK